MKFKLIEEYIQLSKLDRQNHIDLKDPCIFIGGSSHQARLLMAHFLGTTVPKGMKIHLCHACNNGDCSNPKHLYWGTVSENAIDRVNCGRNISYKSLPNHKGKSWIIDSFTGKRKWIDCLSPLSLNWQKQKS